jgi:hypothetical protein
MTAPDSIKQLVDRFEEQKDSYQSTCYNETETCREMIDPFFRSLGWDVDNSQHYAEAYKDVIHEDAIKIIDNYEFLCNWLYPLFPYDNLY